MRAGSAEWGGLLNSITIPWHLHETGAHSDGRDDGTMLVGGRWRRKGRSSQRGGRSEVDAERPGLFNTEAVKEVDADEGLFNTEAVNEVDADEGLFNAEAVNEVDAERDCVEEEEEQQHQFRLRCKKSQREMGGGGGRGEGGGEGGR